MAEHETNTALPRYEAWVDFRATGIWPTGAPAWARNDEGRMDTSTAMRAVIEELRAAVAAPAAQAAVNAPDHKQLQMMRDGAEHTASNDYFRARPKADDRYGRKLFQDAFSMGFYGGWSSRGNYVAGWVAPVPAAPGVAQEPVAWLHEKGISALTAEEMDTARNHLGPAGLRKAALHSIPLYAAPVGQASAQDPAPVAWLHNEGLDAWTAEKKRTVELHQGAPGVKVAARYSIPLVRQVSGQAEDAARYRYLRDEAHPDNEHSGVAVIEDRQNDWGRYYSKHLFGAELDALVDAARAQQAGQAETGDQR